MISTSRSVHVGQKARLLHSIIRLTSPLPVYRYPPEGNVLQCGTVLLVRIAVCKLWPPPSQYIDIFQLTLSNCNHAALRISPQRRKRLLVLISFFYRATLLHTVGTYMQHAHY